MQTTEYQVIDATGFLVSAADNRQTPIRILNEIREAMPYYPIEMPCKVVRIVTEKEIVGWVIE